MRRGAAALLVLLVAGPAVVLHAGPADAQAGPGIEPSTWVECSSAPCASDEDLPAGAGGRHMRLRVEVTVPDGMSAPDLPVTHTIDLAEVLRDDGRTRPPHPHDADNGILQGFELAADSLTLVEVDGAGKPVAQAGKGRLPLMVLGTDGPDFDPRSPVITLQWIMPGTTDGTRYFDLYFDAVHNGERTPATYSDDELGRVATANGPGRGTRFFVPLPGVATGGSEPRSLRVTNLQSTNITATAYEYDFTGNRLGNMAFQVPVPAGIGSSATRTYNEEYKVRGALVVETDGLATVEASHRGTVAQDAYTPGAATLFLPAADGGFVGTRFASTPAADATWNVYCIDASGCTVRFAQGSVQTRRDISVDPQVGAGFISLAVQKGDTATLEAETRVAVQRVTPDKVQRPPAPWPAMDGPVASTTFVGHAKSADGIETLLLSSPRPAQLFVKDLAGAKSVLDGSWDVKPGLQQDSGSSVGLSWGRQWQGTNFEGASHQSGPVVLRPEEGTARLGLNVVSGYINPSDLGAFSALVPLQSPDGGLTYDFHLPGDSSALGRLVLFAPTADTRVAVSGPGAAAPGKVLQADQYLDTADLGIPVRPGPWRIEADAPVVAAWLKRGDDPMAGFAPAITDLATARVTAAQISGYLFGVETDGKLRSVEPGRDVSFTVELTNLARSVRGEPLGDAVILKIQPPGAGWDIQPVFQTVLLEPDGTGSATFTVRVPGNVGDASGALLDLHATSQKGGFAVVTELGLNYIKPHGVQVVADTDFTSKVTKLVQKEGNTSATYVVGVHNTGRSTDAFEVVLPEDAKGWDVEVTPLNFEPVSPQGACPRVGTPHSRTPDLAPLGHVEYKVQVSLDDASGRAFRHLSIVTASSVNDCSAVDSVQLETEVESARHFSVDATDPERVVEPGQETTFRVDIRNHAEVNEELRVTLGGTRPPAWPAPQVRVHLDGPDGPGLPLDAEKPLVVVEPGQDLRLSVTRFVPDGAAPLALALDRVILESTSPQGPSREVDLRTVAAEVRGFEAHVEPHTLAVTPGSSASADVVFTSLGNTDQSLRVGAAAGDGTAWRFRDAQDRSPPWNVSLPAGGEVRLGLRLHAPTDAPPADPARTVATLHVAAPGLATTPVPVTGRVDERPDVEVGVDSLTVGRGRVTEARIPVHNVGNVPLDLRAQWDDLPGGWTVESEPLHLPVGGTGTLTTRIDVPPTQEPGRHAITLTAQQAPSSTIEEVPLDAWVGDPLLEAHYSSATDLGGGQQAFRVQVTNKGDAPAHRVVATLHAGDRELDSVMVQQIVPGRTQSFTLIGGDARDHVVRVTADHDPTGLEVPLEGLDPQPDDRSLPPPAATWAVGAVALAVLLSRRRST